MFNARYRRCRGHYGVYPETHADVLASADPMSAADVAETRGGELEVETVSSRTSTTASTSMPGQSETRNYPPIEAETDLVVQAMEVETGPVAGATQQLEGAPA